MPRRATSFTNRVVSDYFHRQKLGFPSPVAELWQRRQQQQQSLEGERRENQFIVLKINNNTLSERRRRFARLSAGAAQQYPPSTTTKSRLVSPLNSKTRVLPLFLFNIGQSFLPSFLPSFLLWVCTSQSRSDRLRRRKKTGKRIKMAAPGPTISPKLRSLSRCAAEINATRRKNHVVG